MKAFSVGRFVQKETRRAEQFSKRYKKLVTTLGTLQKYAPAKIVYILLTCYNML